jgi:membrane associated rhomboid family serine protease
MPLGTTTSLDASVQDQGRRRTLGLVLVAALVAMMWVIEIVDVFAGDLDSAGIRPRDPEGLIGVALAPVLHGGFGHLAGNTVPFLLLGMAIALSGLARIVAVAVIVAVVGGLGTWLVAAEGTVHIGASGLVFGFAAYLVARGAYTRRALHLVGGLIVIFVYGSTLLFGLVPTPGVSWSGHAFGAVGGVVAAWLLHRGTQRSP